MNRIELGIAAFLVCGSLPVPAGPPAAIEALGWLAGAWETRMGEASIEEHWIAPAGGTMFGVSRTVVKGKTVAFEFLRIETRPEALVYVAQPNGRPGTDFTLTRLSPGSAVFENPGHDHPKVIRYRRDPEGTLTAEVEGHEKGKPLRQQFRFRSRSKEEERLDVPARE